MTAGSEPYLPNEHEPFLRSLLGAVVLLLVARAAEPLFFGEGFYAALTIHPYWLFVILAAVQGGLYVGVSTAAMAALLMDWPPRPAGIDITAHYVELAILPVQWLLMAIIVGSIRQAQIRLEAELRTENARLRRMSEDLATEVNRMDSDVAALELQIATTTHAGGVERSLPALSVLAMADTESFEAKFTEATEALGFAGAVFYAGDDEPLGVGVRLKLTACEAEELRRLTSAGRTNERAVADGTEVAVGVGNSGFLVTIMPRGRPASITDSGGAAIVEDQSASTILSPEPVTCTVALAAALAFYNSRPAIHLRPVSCSDHQQISQ